MSTQANGSHELISTSYSLRKDRDNGTYISLLESNGKSSFCRTVFGLSCTLFLLRLILSSGSFGSTFWYDSNTNRARYDSNEDTWSTAANASTVDGSDVGQGGNWSPGEDVKAKRSKRKA
jgi:hypothetical protein